MLLVTTPVFGTVTVKRASRPGTLDVAIVREPLTVAVKALELHLTRPVQMILSEDPVINYRGRQVAPEAALLGIAAAANIELIVEENQYWLRDVRVPTVTLDVKDGEARDILKSMQRQCGIKNLMIDPNVQGTGTFLFNDVPCAQAFSIVLRSLGLAGVTYPNSVLSVKTP